MAITVFDATGHALFGSGRDRMVAGSLVPEAWVRADEQAADWRADAPDTLIVGSRLTNDFGTASGGVALVYTRAPIDHLLKGALAVLVLVGAILVGLMTVLVWLIAAAMFRRTERRLLEMREGIEALIAPGDPSKPPPPAVDAAFAAAHDRLGRIFGQSGRGLRRPCRNRPRDSLR